MLVLVVDRRCSSQVRWWTTKREAVIVLLVAAGWMSGILSAQQCFERLQRHIPGHRQPLDYIKCIVALRKGDGGLEAIKFEA